MGILGLLAINSVGTASYEKFYARSVLQKLVVGVIPEADYRHCILPRAHTRRDIHIAMNPDKQAHFFSLIYGPPGTGKSTLVQEACQEMGRGVGYINISPMSQDFGKYLGETFSFRFERHVNIFNVFSQAVLGRKAVEVAGGMGKLASLERSCKALHEAAIAFRASEGRPFVLVIDSFDRLIHSERDIAMAFLE